MPGGDPHLRRTPAVLLAHGPAWDRVRFTAFTVAAMCLAAIMATSAGQRVSRLFTRARVKRLRAGFGERSGIFPP
jgi:hypothetical protein